MLNKNFLNHGENPDLSSEPDNFSSFSQNPDSPSTPQTSATTPSPEQAASKEQAAGRANRALGSKVLSLVNFLFAPQTSATTPSPEQAASKEQAADRANRALGSKVLSRVNFQSDRQHKEIVESSYQKARKSHEKFPDKMRPADLRNYSYLSRIENLVEKHGNRAEQRLWEMSSKRLIVQPEDVTDEYWKTHEQNLRDNGYGHELSRWEKETLIHDLQKKQRESLEPWSNYLGDKNSPYPMWFKVYAWDGMSKMGVFDRAKRRFAKRDKSTVAPYPWLNCAALAKTYGAVADFYGISQQLRPTESGFEEVAQNDETSSDSNHESMNDDELRGLIQSGNFNKLYSKFMLEQKTIVPTPERTEDVHGEWIEYLPGEEERVSSAAEGTGWCVADPGTARNYLKYGNYSGGHSHYNNRAKFILFHLNDPETNTLADNACASIRLDPNGKVAEISGLNKGQALEDSLVPIVEAKAKSLPGGERFLEAFADKQELIRLDHKMQNDEPLTAEELKFIWEIDRPIKTLDTYNDEDPRIREFRSHYLDESLDRMGVDINTVVERMGGEGIADNLDTFLAHGLNINALVKKMYDDDIARNLDTLLEHGADINTVMAKMPDWSIAENLDTLLAHGTDINTAMKNMDGYAIAYNIDTLLAHGANIDINALVEEMNSDDIAENLDTLLAHGANIDINALVKKMDSYYIARNLDTLLEHGADINTVMAKMDRYYIVRNLDALIAHGANIDINALVKKMYDDDIARNLDTLLEHGADINTVMAKMISDDIAKNLDTLLAYGADIDTIVGNLNRDDIIENLDTLRAHGANIDPDSLKRTRGGIRHRRITKRPARFPRILV